MPTLDKKNPYNIFVINPGSTSTKVAHFLNERMISQQTFSHTSELHQFPSLWDQLEFRFSCIQQFLQEKNISELDATVGRGGLLKPVTRGTYAVNETMLNDALKGVQGQHAANLGCALAHRIGNLYNCPAYVVDPVSVDEFADVARLSGHPRIERRTLSHALNLRAAALWVAKMLNVPPTQQNLVVAHMGGGISIAAIQQGNIVDVNDAASSGPFSPERSGSLPLQQFMDLCFSGEYTPDQMRKMVMGEGGLKAYLGTSDLQEVEDRIAHGDRHAELVYHAMIYQTAKEIAAMATVSKGQLQAIVLTGGLANSKQFVRLLSERISFLAPVHVLPGELEMQAMAAGAYRVLSGEESINIY